jgi:hypothetical protein
VWCACRFQAVPGPLWANHNVGPLRHPFKALMWGSTKAAHEIHGPPGLCGSAFYRRSPLRLPPVKSKCERFTGRLPSAPAGSQNGGVPGRTSPF